MCGKKVSNLLHGSKLVTVLGGVLALLTLAVSIADADRGQNLIAYVGIGLHIDDYELTEFWPTLWPEESETDTGIGGKLALGTRLAGSLEFGFSLLQSFTGDNDLFELSPVVYLAQHVRIEDDMWLYVGPQIGGTYYDFDDYGVDDFGFSAGALLGLRWSDIFVEYNFLWTDVDTHRSWRDVEGDLYTHKFLVGLRFEF